LETVAELTSGERVHYLIEATGNPVVFEQMAGILCRQGTVLIFGTGYKGRDISLIEPLLFLDLTLVVSVGASGGFDQNGRPATYRRALELVSASKVRVLPLITHRYYALDDVHMAFDQDFGREDYIKGLLSLDSTTGAGTMRA